MSVTARVLRLLNARRALVAGICVGVATFLLAPVHHRVSSRLLLGWDAAVLTYLLYAGRALYRSAVDDIRRHAALSSEGRPAPTPRRTVPLRPLRYSISLSGFQRFPFAAIPTFSTCGPRARIFSAIAP